MSHSYRIRSEETWAQARDHYVAGLTAEAVCRRHDLGLSTFRRRAREGGWRRADQDDPTPGVSDLEIYDDLVEDEEIRLALLRYREALTQGRVLDAGRWRKLWRQLCRSRDELNAQMFPGLTRLELDRLLQDSDDEEPGMDALETAPRVASPPAQASNVHDVHSKISSAPAVPEAGMQDPSNRRERRRQAREARRR